jgi:hypothetical protein
MPTNEGEDIVDGMILMVEEILDHIEKEELKEAVKKLKQLQMMWLSNFRLIKKNYTGQKWEGIQPYKEFILWSIREATEKIEKEDGYDFDIPVDTIKDQMESLKLLL